MSGDHSEFGTLQLALALLVAAVADGVNAAQTRDFGSLAGACATLRLAFALMFPRLERLQLQAPLFAAR